MTRTGIVTAVIVTFDPEPLRFSAQTKALCSQTNRSIIVDNGSSESTLFWLRAIANESGQRITLVELGRNKGIAYAQNVGIRLALQHECSHVLLMDHDSVPAPGMTASLLEALTKLQGEGKRVAATGPRYLDDRQDNPPPFIRVRGLRLRRQPCPSASTVTEVDYLIASGSLIPRDTFEAVGMMNEAFFIDYVDIEWGLRARQKGYLSYGVCAAGMAHDLGDTPIRFMGRSLPSHSPIRHYYHFRNAIWMHLRSRAPMQWKFVDAYRLILRFGFYSCFGEPRLQHVSHMLRGLRDGLMNRLGPAPEQPMRRVVVRAR